MDNDTRGHGRGALLLLACAGALAFGVAACGDDDSDSGGEGEQAAVATAAEGERCEQMTKAKISTQPIAPLAALYLGEEKGFFEDENIDLEISGGIQGGAASAASVMSGADDFGFSDWVGLYFAADKGLPISVIAPAAGAGTEDAKSYIAVLASKESGIRTPADLEGKTIAINAVNNVTDVSIKGALEKEGVASDSVKFLEVPFPQTEATVSQGRADAGFFVEPFVSAGLAAGLVPVMYPIQAIAPEGGVISGFFTKRDRAESDACLVGGFVRAMNKSNEYAEAHPDEVRATLPTFTEIPPEVAERMRLPVYGEPGLQAATAFNDLMADLELIKQPLDLSELIVYEQQ